MNKARRASLSALQDTIQGIMDDIEGDEVDWDAAKGAVEAAATDAENLKDEEQDYYDNMPSGLQGGDKGDTAQSAIDAMENADTALSEAAGHIEAKDAESAVASLEEARDFLNEAEA